MTLYRADPCRVKNIHYAFYLDSDIALSIVGEMAEQLDCSYEDVAVIAEIQLRVHQTQLLNNILSHCWLMGRTEHCGASSFRNVH